MEVKNILSRDSIRCEPRVGSKKHALDILSEMLATAASGPSAGEVLEGLVSRERLGSTGLGGSVAMPHARQPGIAGKVGAVLKLAEPVDFGAPDGRPVDLLFGLLVPEGGDPAELDEILELVRNLRDPDVQDALRGSTGPRSLYELLARELGTAPGAHARE